MPPITQEAKDALLEELKSEEAQHHMSPDGRAAIARAIEIVESFPVSDGWAPFVGLYEKKWYDVRRVKRRDASGNVLEYEIVPHCWPNAGNLNETSESQRSWGPDSKIEFRLSATHPMGWPQE